MHDVRRLRIFVEVAERGSLAGAAAALSYTPSAVSQHIAALERELNAQVLLRTGRGSELTEAGRALLPHARAVLERLGLAAAEVRAITDRDATLRVASFGSAEITLMPHALAALRRAGRSTRIATIRAEPPEAMRLVRSGGADCALVFDYGGHAATQPGDDFMRL